MAIFVFSVECGSGSIYLHFNETQNLTSPGFPYNYRNDLICRWIVTATDSIDNAFIYVTFIEFDLERGYDFLHIGDGYDPNDETTVIGSFTGLLKLRVISSKASNLWMMMITDISETRKGFHIDLTCKTKKGMMTYFYYYLKYNFTQTMCVRTTVLRSAILILRYDYMT